MRVCHALAKTSSVTPGAHGVAGMLLIRSAHLPQSQMIYAFTFSATSPSSLQTDPNDNWLQRRHRRTVPVLRPHQSVAEPPVTLSSVLYFAWLLSCRVFLQRCSLAIFLMSISQIKSTSGFLNILLFTIESEVFKRRVTPSLTILKVHMILHLNDSTYVVR